MKKYLVIRTYKYASPDICQQVSTKQDAIAMRDILQRNDKEHQYFVFELTA